jgi:hypothetical protein
VRLSILPNYMNIECLKVHNFLTIFVIPQSNGLKTFYPLKRPFKLVQKLSTFPIKVHFITNLTFHDLVIEIMQNLFIHNFTFCTLISCIENTFNTWIYKKIQNLCDIHSFIGSYFIHQHIYLC